MFLASQGHFAISLEGKNMNEDAFQLCLGKTQHLFQLSFSNVVNLIVITSFFGCKKFFLRFTQYC